MSQPNLFLHNFNFLNKKDWTALAVITVIALMCFLPGLNAYGMLDPTDSFFFEVPREMIECGHYVTAIYNYIDWLDKPAFPFWLNILSYKLLGINDFAARLPAALSGIVLVIGTYLFSLKRIARRGAILSALTLSASPLFLIVGHVALSDEALSMLFGVAMLFVGSALSSSHSKINLIAYVFLALAVLCKGPIALVLTVGTVFAYLLIVTNSFAELKNNLFKLKPFAAILILLAVCLPYYYFAHVTTAGAFTEQFFLRQNLGRLQGKVNHLEPVWFYIPVFFAGYFPWCFYLFFSVPWIKKIFNHRFNLTERQKFIVFCLCWFSFVALLFTIIPTRLPTYIVPFSPALAVLVGSYLEVVLRAKAFEKLVLPGRSSAMHKLLFSLPPMIAVLASILAFCVLTAKMLKGGLFISMSLGLFITACSSLLCVFSWWSKKYKSAVLSLYLSSLLGCAILVPTSFCWFYQSHQLVFKHMIEVIQSRKANVATLFSPVPSLIFYLHRQVPNVESVEELAAFCKIGKSPHVLMASRNCFNMSELRAAEHIIHTEGKWYLLDVEGFPWR